MSLFVRPSVGPPHMLVLLHVLLSDEPVLSGLFLCTTALRVLVVLSGSTGLRVSGVVHALRSVLGVGWSTTDMLQSALIVADCMLALHSAAMRSATGTTLATKCCL